MVDPAIFEQLQERVDQDSTVREVSGGETMLAVVRG